MSAVLERVRSSLFLVPMAGVLAAIALAALTIVVDSRVVTSSSDLPLGLASTVESARSILSTIAGATITVAAITFSVSLLIIQQASGQFSPRVVHTLFRDPFNRRVMGIVVGTFTYCLVVLRSVHTAIEKNGEPVVPNLSVAIAVALGITTILAIIAFIDHSAHSMDVSRILDNVQREAIGQIRKEWPLADPEDRSAPPPPSSRRSLGGDRCVRFDRSGWIQELDLEAMLDVVPDSATMRVEAFPGRYAVEGTPLCTISGAPDRVGTDRRPGDDDEDDLARGVRAAVSIGDTRTMQQDVSFGLRQLADVALKALSPGINDPTTAQDAIFHSAAVLGELLRRDPPLVPGVDDAEGRVVLVQQPGHDDLVHLAFDETRRAAADQPTVSIYLLEALALLVESTHHVGLGSRCRPLVEQADLVLAGCRRADLLPEDLDAVEAAHVRLARSIP